MTKKFKKANKHTIEHPSELREWVPPLRLSLRTDGLCTVCNKWPSRSVGRLCVHCEHLPDSPVYLPAQATNLRVRYLTA
jgi:hypothetical protein